MNHFSNAHDLFTAYQFTIRDVHRWPRLPGRRSMRNFGEWRACRYLLRNGHHIVAHNIGLLNIEIDVVTIQSCVHFVEVKSHSTSHIHPLKSQNSRRRHKVRKSVGAFLRQYVSYLHDAGHKVLASELESNDLPISFDLLWVKSDGLEFFESIF